MENRNKFHDMHNPSNNSIYQVKNMLVFDNEVQNDNNNNNQSLFPLTGVGYMDQITP
jgi:hypothetical protein